MTETEARVEAQNLLDIAALEDMEFQPPCAAPGHPEGRDGCEADAGATYIARLTHAGKGCTPVVILYCIGHTIWLRGSLRIPCACPRCGKDGVLGDFAEIVGPIDPAKK